MLTHLMQRREARQISEAQRLGDDMIQHGIDDDNVNDPVDNRGSTTTASTGKFSRLLHVGYLTLLIVLLAIFGYLLHD